MPGSHASYMSGGMSCASAVTTRSNCRRRSGDLADGLDAAVRLGGHRGLRGAALELGRETVERHDQAAGEHEADLAVVAPPQAASSVTGSYAAQGSDDQRRAAPPPAAADCARPRLTAASAAPAGLCCDAARHLRCREAGAHQAQRVVPVRQVLPSACWRQDDACLAGDELRRHGHDLAVGALDQDRVALLGQVAS